MGQSASAVVNASRHESAEFGYRPGPQFSEELRGKIALQLQELEGRGQPVPITFNEEVAASLEYFLTDARNFMVRSLERSGKYVPMMKRIFAEKGLPPDLVYLALIESGYRWDAVSPARAVGPWQFIRATGKRYGLAINEWVDERMDPEKSTRAAAAYLSDLHDRFGCWQLAAAAYNAGEGTIEKALKRCNAQTFWEIAETGDYIRPETKDYVPKFLAALIIAKDPARYGLVGLNPAPPWQYDVMVCSYPTDLEVIARLAGTGESEIRELNPHIKLWCTPLDAKNYQIRVPRGTGGAVQTQYARLNPDQCVKVSVHTVRSGESLKSIASRYQLSSSTIKQFNNLRSTRLKKGQKIKLPLDERTYEARKRETEIITARARKKLEKSGSKVVYTVKPGDTPWKIARNYDVSWKDIVAWNQLSKSGVILPGQKLVLYSGTGPSSQERTASLSADRKKVQPSPSSRSASSGRASSGEYAVQAGDTLWKIAFRFNVSPEELAAMNGLKNNQILPGQKLKIKTDGVKSGTSQAKASDPKPEQVKKTQVSKTAGSGSSGTTQYRVVANDTLWKISQKFNVSAEELRAANGMKDDGIRPGQTLNIPQKAAPKNTGASKSAPKTDGVTQKRTAAKDSKPQKVSYTVKDGDTVWKIAKLFKVNPEQIRAWNKLADDNIRPGDVLTIIPEKG